MSKAPKIIYLEPDCPNCGEPQSDEGRLWCEDDVWSRCEGCGAPVRGIKYQKVQQ